MSPSPTINAWKLRELADLEEDWNGCGEQPITPAALTTARGMYLCPLPNGGLQYEMHSGGWDVEIEIDPDGSVCGFYAFKADPPPSSSDLGDTQP